MMAYEDFIERVASDADFNMKFTNAMSDEEVLAVAAENGYELTVDDFRRDLRLN